MKKTVAAIILILMLLNTAFFALADDSVDIRERLGKEDLNIITSFAITYTDSSGNPVTEPNINSKINIRFDWEIDNLDAMQIEDGDTFLFTLPDSFKIINNITVPLSEFGSVLISKDRTILMTFNEQVQQHSEVSGFIELGARFNSDVIKVPGEHVIKMPVVEEGTVTVNIRPDSDQDAFDKQGKFDRQQNPTSIIWEVRINKDYSVLENVQVTDIIPSGLTLQSVEVYPLNLNHDGTFKSYGAKLEDGYTLESATVKFVEISRPYAIRYITSISEDFKPADGGNVKFTNNAEMTYDGGKFTADAEITANYGKLLDKQDNPAYDYASQTLTWTVVYNSGEKTLINPLLTDTFDDKLEYVAESLKILDADNDATSYSYTVTNSPKNKLQIQFNETVNEKLVISYKTKVKDDYMILNSETYHNLIEGHGKSDSSSGKVYPQLVRKSAPSIDYSAKQIKWRIDVNVNQYELQEYSLTDIYDFLGLNLVESTFKISDITDSANSVVLTRNTDYILTKTYTGEIETGFRINFINDYASTSSRLRIEYTTDYDPNGLVGTDETEFKNTAKLNWTDEEETEREHSASETVPVNDETENNGAKWGSYNAVTKEITWTVSANYNREEYSSPKITDKIRAGQTYVEGSLIIREYTVNAKGEIIAVSLPSELSLFTIEYPKLSNDYTLTVQFPLTDKLYQIEFKTSIENEMITDEYFNTAIFTNGTYTRTLDASVTVNHGNKLLNKSGEQNGSLINWVIAINESQSTIEDAVLTDIPCMNQQFLEDTFRLYPVIVNSDETYTVDHLNPLVLGEDYDLKITTELSGQQKFELAFLFTISRTYVLEYDAQISASPGTTQVSNSSKLAGNSTEYEDEGGGTSVVIDVSSAGAGAVGVKGSFTIQKNGEDGAALEGVGFDLYNPLNRKIASFKTDSEGKITLGNLVYGKYRLVETSTLDGYVISDELFAGMEITVSQETSSPQNPVRITNAKNKLTIRKVGENTELLDGSVFKLEQASGESYELIDGNLLVEGGEIVLKGLETGSYRLTELTVPEGYIKNIKPLTFEIIANANGQAIDKTVEFVNYQGKVRLTKVDSDENALSEAQFNLYSGDEELIKSNLQTNLAGIIEVDCLKPGNYYFIETKSAGGNIVNDTPIPFTIPDEFAGVPPVMILNATNSKGEVFFKKTGVDSQFLTNTLFELYKRGEPEDIMVAMAASNEEGEVRASNLEPGSYYFKEKYAPAGCILNTMLIEFEIPETASVDKVVIELDDFVNCHGKVILSKVDAKGKLLREAEFNLLDAEGIIIGTYSTQKGVLEIDNLAPGSYQIVETKAPKGYILDENPIDVEIPAEFEGIFETITISKVNVIIPPKTGDDSYVSIYLSLAVISAGLLIALVIKKKKVQYK